MLHLQEKNFTTVNLLLLRWVYKNLTHYYTWVLDLKQSFFAVYSQKRSLRRFLKQKPVLQHPYHLVNASPWPLFVALALGNVTIGAVLFFHQYRLGLYLLFFGLAYLLFCAVCWFRDIIREGTFEGRHTLLVQRGLKLGMILFIVSEIMLFFAFFWGFFHSSLAPAIQIGGIWPPAAIAVFNPMEVPLLNTIILLTSGVTVTWAHYAIRNPQDRFYQPRFFPGIQHLEDFAPIAKKLKRENVTLAVSRMLPDPYFGGDFSTHDMFRVRLAHLNWVRPLNALLLVFLPVINTDFTKNPRQLKVFITKRFAEWKSILEENVRDTSLTLYLKDLIRDLPHLIFHVKQFYFRYSISYLGDLLIGLRLTIFLGCIFTLVQFFEYTHAAFNIADSVYGSTFFLTTGFHGLHVLIGTLFLLVCYYRAKHQHFTVQHHVGLESAIWYWHFVDVVWLGLYISIYHWGGSILF